MDWNSFKVQETNSCKSAQELQRDSLSDRGWKFLPKKITKLCSVLTICLTGTIGFAEDQSSFLRPITGQTSSANEIGTELNSSGIQPLSPLLQDALAEDPKVEETAPGLPNENTEELELPKADGEGDPENGDEEKKEEEEDDLLKLLDEADKNVETLQNVQVAPEAAASGPVQELLDAPVSTVSRKVSTVGRSPAAVFVITNEMIRRSGARTIPDVLRLAPGVQVAQMDSNKWAISIRGFNERYSNKLLVQIDGRTVYTPLFAGVYWDMHNILLEDIQRIEVIRGPGATVWGANAVNGVINILTKKAKDTQGLFFEAGHGNYHRNFSSLRYGGGNGDEFNYRIFGTWFENEHNRSPIGAEEDNWNGGRFGFRMDYEPNDSDTITLQGDHFEGHSGGHQSFVRPFPPFAVDFRDKEINRNSNVLFRYSRTIDEDTDWALQMYYDRVDRTFDIDTFENVRDTYDIDFQHRFSPWEAHSIVWGLGWRHYDQRTRTTDPGQVSFVPNSMVLNRYSAFIQDDITLSEDELYFTLGSKFSHNDYTGFEIQPSARLLFTPNNQTSIWASVSRAVRTPSIVENNGVIPLGAQFPLGPSPPFPPFFPTIFGSTTLPSEEVIAYELGMRQQVDEDFSWDLALFYNDYDHIRSVVPIGLIPTPGGVLVPHTVLFNGTAESFGGELAVNYRISDTWRLNGAYSYLRQFLHDVNITDQFEGSIPRNQFYLRSAMDLAENYELDLIARYVDNLPTENVPWYFTCDVRLAWHPTDELEVYLVGRNLLDRSHPEFGDDAFTGGLAVETRRSIYAGLSLRY